MSNPAMPTSTPASSSAGGILLAALVVVIVNRRAMLTLGTGATEVLLDEARS